MSETYCHNNSLKCNVISFTQRNRVILPVDNTYLNRTRRESLYISCRWLDENTAISWLYKNKFSQKGLGCYFC